MSGMRRTALAVLTAVLGIVLAAAITWGTSQLVSQHIGLASEPLTAGSSLLPRATAAKPSAARPRHVTSTPSRPTPSTITVTPAPPPAVTEQPAVTATPAAPAAPASEEPAAAETQQTRGEGSSGEGDHRTHRDD